jgi:hypothetical protein
MKEKAIIGNNGISLNVKYGEMAAAKCEKQRKANINMSLLKAS